MSLQRIFSAVILLSATSLTYAGSWAACGTLADLANGNGVLPGKTLVNYEYGIAYNSPEPLPVHVTTWNVGIRVYNKLPYLIETDNPEDVNANKLGGFIFYRGTYASDDNCGAGSFRHHYWAQDTDHTAILNYNGYYSNGCYGKNITVYCRTR